MSLREGLTLLFMKMDLRFPLLSSGLKRRAVRRETDVSGELIASNLRAD
jgi:hypothetical protein